MMPNFRKLPVVIEAVEWTGNNMYEVIELTEASDLLGFSSDKVSIETLEGVMTANVGDYIIKGVNGEFYPCKPDIFTKTYEQVNELVCTAPQDPEPTLDEVATLASNGSLCGCTWVEVDGTEHPIEKGDLVDFGTALHLMQLGERVMREGWNGKNMWLIYVEADQYELKAWKYFNATEQLPFIALKTADNNIVPWTISQADALATDWQLA